MANKVVKFGAWFDPKNLEHMRAFKHLSVTGSWPEGFIPDYVELDSFWQFEAVSKMAFSWMAHMLPPDEGKENQ